MCYKRRSGDGGGVVIVETKAACMVKTTLQYAKKYTEFSVHRCVYSDWYCLKTSKHQKQTRSDRREQGQKKIFRRTPPERMRLKTTNLLYASTLDRNSRASTKNSPKDLSFPPKPPAYRKVFSKHTADVPGRFGRFVRRIHRSIRCRRWRH